MRFDALRMKPFKEWFDEIVRKYNVASFIDNDPIIIPHSYKRKVDIEIAGFFAATLSWGKRSTIISKTKELMQRMGNTPAEFILHNNEKKFKALLGFVHRTFNEDDIIFLSKGLHRIYNEEGGMETLLAPKPHESDTSNGITRFRKQMLKEAYLPRHARLIPDPIKGSAAKRLNMFLRWMIREDNQCIDFGIWKASPASLVCPLDIHTGRMARHLGLLNRKQNDWKAVEELTGNLRLLDPSDPIKYDIALFGLSTDKTFFKSRQ